MLAQAALERSTIPEDDRTPTFVYVDEAQEYFDDTIETILSQARKYRVGHHARAPDARPALPAPARGVPFEHELQMRRRRLGAGRAGARERATYRRRSSSRACVDAASGPSSRSGSSTGRRTPCGLSVPLGFLERQPTLTEEEYDELIRLNRARYCGAARATLSGARAHRIRTSIERAATADPRATVPGRRARRRSHRTRAAATDRPAAAEVPGQGRPQAPLRPIARERAWRAAGLPRDP